MLAILGVWGTPASDLCIVQSLNCHQWANMVYNLDCDPLTGLTLALCASSEQCAINGGQDWRCSAHVQGHCPASMTITDLVFLEPRLLLVDDPSAVGPHTWQVIRRVAESIRQLMTRRGLLRTPELVEARRQDTFSFCDAVPVCHHVLQFLARVCQWRA